MSKWLRGYACRAAACDGEVGTENKLIIHNFLQRTIYVLFGTWCRRVLKEEPDGWRALSEMSIQIINLNKLLKLCLLPENKLITELKADLNTERKKLLGQKSGGGNFHNPWWEVAKDHVIGEADLQEMLPFLVAGGINRDRLYPMLTGAFLRWLDEFRRNTNMPIGVSEEEVHCHYVVPGMDLTVKVDNLLALRFGPDGHRLVYPYFTEQPALTEEWARVGIWLMRDALSEFDITQMEILDVLRSRSFRGSSVFLKGNEEAIFTAKYRQMLGLWAKFRPDYGLA